MSSGDGFACSFGAYRILLFPAGLPLLYPHFCAQAGLSDQVEPFNEPEGQMCCMVVRKEEKVVLVVAQKYSAGTLWPEAHVVPETDVLFLGAGERLLGYDLKVPRRLWQDSTDFGFHGWRRHDDVILMSAECELAAWDLHGKKLWTALDAIFVEPPWDYSVQDGMVRLDVMGKVVTFPLRDGPRTSDRG